MSQKLLRLPIYFSTCLFAILLFVRAQGQTMYNNGALIVITAPSGANPPTILHINGGFENNSSGAFFGRVINNGDMTITRNSFLNMPGTVHLANGSTMEGNGRYYVEQDWINDANFIANNSEVILYSDNTQQYITGTSVTEFNKLTLTGTGQMEALRKTMMINSRIGINGHLALNNRELETLGFIMNVLNPDPAAISRADVVNGGFVSSLLGGELQRATLRTENYLFPTGASQGDKMRYRAVMLTPSDAKPNVFGVRMVNNDADIDNVPTSLGAIPGVIDNYNHFFYHTITRSEGTARADINIFYDVDDEGPFASINFWEEELRGWRNAESTSPGSIAYYNFASQRRSMWPFLKEADKHFILVNEGSGIIENIPNVFSPNGDNVNDLFHIDYKNLANFHFMVFNRWGNLLFESNSANIDWDGKTLAGSDVPDGTYFYAIEATLMDQSVVEQKGFFNIVR